MYLYMALTSSASTLTLPSLAALPYAGAALQELQTKAGLYGIFRTGRKAYYGGKTIGCLASAVLGQIVPIGIIIILGLGFANYDEGYVLTGTLVKALLARLVCAGMWGCLAGGIGMITQVSSAVYIGPLAVSFSLSLIGRRLLPKHTWMDPQKWLLGENMFFMSILLLLTVGFYFHTLAKVVKKHA